MRRAPSRWLPLLAALALGAPAVGQVRGPATAAPGTTIRIDVVGSHLTVGYSFSGSSQVRWRLVGPSQQVVIEVPPGASGQVLRVRVGAPGRYHVHEVVIS
ncbi:MAG: hypothetical protein KAI24_15970 [Planctomycetes bacterium]|nr:hypothetical protein [Planctomycetota bacterium]